MPQGRERLGSDVKARASKTLPKMRQHLERAKSIKDSLDRAGDQQ